MINKKTLSTSVSYYNKKEIIIWNTPYSLGNNLTNRKITNYIRYSTSMSYYHRSIFIGILLGDAHIRKINSPINNARIIFKQSIINFPYIWFVFRELCPYCVSYPKLEIAEIGSFQGQRLENNKLAGQRYGVISNKYFLVVFGTRNYPFLNELYEMFIKNGKKRVPITIFDELTPVALAHWIMCDGAWTHYGITLCTDSFTIKDVVILMNVLLIKYNIISSLHKAAGHPRIYIGSKEIHKLKNVVNEHIISFSRYKLGERQMR